MSNPNSRPASHLKFSKQRVLALQNSSTGVTYYYDTETRGLALSVGVSGRKSFFLYRKVNGKPHRLKIGLFPETSVEQARAAADEMNGRIARGEHLGATGAKGPAVTFRDLFADYMEKHSKPRKLTWDEDEKLFERNLTGKTSRKGEIRLNLADMPIGAIDVHVVTALHRNISHAKITANRTLALISSVFSHAIREGLYDGLNPCRGIRKNKEQAREKFLQRDEAPVLFEAMSKEEDGDQTADFISLALATGARRGNVLAMAWSEISWPRAEWHIIRTKNGESQTLPLEQGAVEILKRRLKAQQEKKIRSLYVFPASRGEGHLVDPRKGWRRICARATALQLMRRLLDGQHVTSAEAADAEAIAIRFPKQVIDKYEPLAKQHMVHQSSYDMRKLRVHDLRRTVGSWLASSGASLPLIGKVLNHKSAQSTQVYARFMLDPVRQALEQVAGSMREAGRN
jgi:integrase